MKRRDFLLAGAALGAATLLPSGPALAGRGRVRMGMIGTGARGQVLLRELLRRDDVEVVALCDIEPLMTVTEVDAHEKACSDRYTALATVRFISFPYFSHFIFLVFR